jgi:restriction endonuclease S subunit/type I restriction-modification system DNA methylase subunit
MSSELNSIDLISNLSSSDSVSNLDTKGKYYCKICNKYSKQKGHHETHLNSEAHKNQRKIFELELEKLSKQELIKEYGCDVISKIVQKMENEDNIYKYKKSNKLYFENDEDTINKSNNSESFKNKFLDFLGKQHNLLRGASVTGDEALDDILHCLCLCYLEDKISENGRFDLANSEKSCYKGIIQMKVKDYVKYIMVSYLLEHTEELRAEGTDAIQKCGKLLSKHPVTKPIFENNENFINCQDTQILCELLNNCKEFSQNQNIFQKVDITGIAYEYMTTKHAGNGGTSKEMGQYFTERPLMGMCFQLIDKSDISELGIDDNSTLGDEFCATLGFPLMAREFLKGHNINIQDKNIYGVEWHERLSKFAYMNAMFSMDNFKNVKRGNSFITNVIPHLDISVHNVPFGKSMTPNMIEKGYDAFLAENPNKDFPEFKDYVPFNTKKIDAILASQVVLYKTRKMGLMIIKDGEETSGKSNDKYRKWFMENCIIKKIMKIPSGAFTCTGTKTVCIYFIKKEGHMTENIQFLQLSDDGNKITEICHVSMADMKENYYSWDPNSYIIDEEMEKMISKSKCEWKKLGEVCEFLKGSRRNANIALNSGLYKFITCSVKGYHYLNEYDFKDEGLIINSINGSGKCMIYISEKYSTTTNNIHFKTKDNKIIKNNIIYYFFLNNLDLLEKGFTGSNQKKISIDYLSNIKIPIPTIEVQNQVVQILDDLAEQKQLLSDRKSGIERQMKYYFETQIKKHIDNITFKKIIDLSTIKSGKRLPKGHVLTSEKTDHPYIRITDMKDRRISDNNIKYITDDTYKNISKYIVNTGDIIVSIAGTIGLISIIETKFNNANLTENCVKILLNNNNIVEKKYFIYVFSLLKKKNIIMNTGGSGIPKLSIEKLSKLLIPVSSIEIHTEIVQYLDKLEAKKNSIDDEIIEIDNLMKQVLEQSYN